MAGSRGVRLGGALALAMLVACGGSTSKNAPPRSRLLILGFDGVDPRFLQRWMDEGQLPHLRELAERGSFNVLKSTNPPQSPVAWTSFATGTGPERHGIFDFVKRDPQTYLPDIGTGGVRPPQFLFGRIRRTSARGFTERHGTPFWQIAAAHGVRATVLRVPYAFPPDPVPGGHMLSGLGVPDLLGTNSTFTYLASDLAAGAERDPGGGRLVPLTLRGDLAEVDLPGIPDPRGEGYAPLPLHVGFHLERTAPAVVVRFAGREEAVKVGEWSSWFAFQLPVARVLGFTLFQIDGLCRFHVAALEPLRVYMSPLNYAPAAPYAAISSPASYAPELASTVGLFKTVGWSEDTSALNAERFDEEAFLADMNHTMDEVAVGTQTALERHDWDLLVSVFTQTDRVAHMFYRLLDPGHPRYDAQLAVKYGDAILRVYQRMDAIVASVASRIGPETTLLIVSDHGFHSYRMGLNVNTWLLGHGFLVQGTVPAGRESDDFFPGVDWGRSKAYALGTGQVYVNLRGREGQGIVAPGKEYDDLLDAIVKGLEAEVDPATGEPVVARVYKGRDIFPGAPVERAPDLQIAFRDGYRTSWKTPLGGIPRELFEPNRKKWSGDHAASDVADTPGILLASRKLSVESPAIVDLAPTVLSFFGVPVPQEMTGKRLWEMP